MESPEKKKSSSSTSSFSSLPDEIAVSCLARIPRSYYPRLSIVSKRFRWLLSSPELYAARSLLGTTEQCLYLCVRDDSLKFFEWFTLWNNPNPTTPDVKKKKLVPVPSSNFPSVSYPTAAGSEIYIIGKRVRDQVSSAVRVLDCRTHTWRDAPSMNVARKITDKCVYDGKIYVIGGVKVDESPFFEVFDIEAQTWECLPDPGVQVRSFGDYYRIAGFEGKIYYGNPYSMSTSAFAYDLEQRKWECCENKTAMLWSSMCVIENVFYKYDLHYGQKKIVWYDIKDGEWKEVKGLVGKIMPESHHGYVVSRVMSVGGKLLAVWEEYIIPTRIFSDWVYYRNPREEYISPREKKILFAEIIVEKRDNGEIWGDIEWVDVVHTIPSSWNIFDCLAILL